MEHYDPASFALGYFWGFLTCGVIVALSLLFSGRGKKKGG